MSISKIKRIRINNAKPNMILAEDAVSDSGVVIIAKNTMLNNLNYDKLESNGIEFISIFQKEEDLGNNFNEDIFLENKEYQTLEDRKEFKNFKEFYKNAVKILEEKFDDIVNNKVLKIDEIYHIIINVLDKVNSKNDIFYYLVNLKCLDMHIYSHSLNVSIISHLFGLWLGYEGEDLKNLTVSAALHDIGKTQIDNNIIIKPGKLTDKEYEIMKRHPHIGYKILENFYISEEIKSGVLMHHEKIDGSGYPIGLTGDRISKIGKIIGICDIYEAMTADRIYRPKFCPFEVIRTFEQNSYEFLDPDLLLVFLQSIVYTYVGSKVILSNGKEAEIVFVNQSNLSRPIIKSGEEFIDLSQINDINIDHII